MTSVGPGSSIQRSCSSVMTSVVTTMIDSSAAGLTRIAASTCRATEASSRLVDGDAGLVGHLDAHESSSLRSSAAFAALPCYR